MTERICRHKHPDPRATSYFCTLCRFSLQHPGFYSGDPIPPQAPARSPLRLHCVHRGEKIRSLSAGCGSCTVWKCARHTECVLIPNRNAGGLSVCQTCPDYADHKADVIIDQGGSGIGDGLLGLLAVKAYKLKHPDKIIDYRVSHAAYPFVHLLDGYDWLSYHARDHNSSPTEGAIQINLGYDAGLRNNTPFIERYCSNLGVSEPMLPDLRPEVVPNPAFAGTVLLAPKSAYSCREWSLLNWKAFAGLLRMEGLRPVVVCDKPLGFECEELTGRDAKEVAGAFLAASVIIGNDSGPAHFAGILRRPTIVLTGPTTKDLIYGAYPNVSEVAGTLWCRGCKWQQPYNPSACDRECASLQTITPETVLAAVKRTVQC